MSTVIKVKLPDKNGNVDIPDIDYINQKLDNIKNMILESSSNNTKVSINDTSMKITPDSKELDLSKLTVKTEDLKQDSSHRMLTDAQILLFKNKPTIQEVNDKVAYASEEMKKFIDKTFTNILNLPNALSNLQLIVDLFVNSPLNTDDGIKTIINEFRQLREQIEDHMLSRNHLNNNERKALNLTTELVNSGMMDKVCSGSVPHADLCYSAKTIEGLTLEELRGRHLEEVVYGTKPYNGYLVDVLLYQSDILDEEFNTTRPSKGVISFKPGVYDKFDIFNIKSEDDLILNGSGCKTTIIKANSIYTENNRIRDCCFCGTEDNPCKIDVSNNTSFTDCQFVNCEINITANTNVRFMNCIFISSHKFDISKYTENILVVYNTFDMNSKVPQSMGISNRIIKDNFSSF